MSVSDPLLKRLKGFIKDLRTDPGTITDNHPAVQPFCEVLELIFRKGLKQSSTLFGRIKRDYWNWINIVGENGNNNWGNNERVNPIFSMVKYTVKNCDKVIINQGRGRFFMRLALQKKTLCVPIEMLLKNAKLCESWYEPGISIIGDEILSEILMSLLFETTEVNFQLNTKNCAFLDQTWTIPVYRCIELVPCRELGISLQFVDGRAIVTAVQPGSVAEEDDKITPGDVLDELLGESLRKTKSSKIGNLLKQNQGFPITICVVKCHKKDGSVFKPIAELLRRVGSDVASLQRVLAEEEDRRRQQEAGMFALDTTPKDRVPPHAQLPDDEYEELPVHNADDRAQYLVEMFGRTEVGSDGGVQKVEGAVRHQLAFNKGKPLQKVIFELGETDVLVKDYLTKELLHKHSYTEISSCGRTVDCVETFAYIAGETTCTLAKQFVAYVFKAESEELSKTILCSIGTPAIDDLSDFGCTPKDLSDMFAHSAAETRLDP